MGSPFAAQRPPFRALWQGLTWLAAQAWPASAGRCQCPDCSGALSLVTPSSGDGQHIKLTRVTQGYDDRGRPFERIVNASTDCAHCHGTGHEPPRYRTRACTCACCQKRTA